MDDARHELLDLTSRLLEAIRTRDWPTYESLCDPGLTCFEPETGGELVAGLAFHRFYFDLGGHLGPHANTVCAPHIWQLGDVAVVSYVRLVQRADPEGRPETKRLSETRVRRRTTPGWRHVHYHSS